jgi:hypothetical protein
LGTTSLEAGAYQQIVNFLLCFILLLEPLLCFFCFDGSLAAASSLLAPRVNAVKSKLRIGPIAETMSG